MSSRISHWCYSCRKLVSTGGQNDFCSNCGGGFVQKILDMVDINQSHLGSSEDHDESSGSFSFWNLFKRLPSNSAGHMGSSGPRREHGGVVPRLIYSGQLPPGIAEPSNLGPSLGGNYFVGPGAEEYIQEIASSQHGSPLTSNSKIDLMPLIKISKKHVRCDTQHCAICKEKFKLGSYARKTPCDHIYHSECIVPWIKNHSTCPVCRKELQSKRSDDQDDVCRSRSSDLSSGNGNSRRPNQQTRSRFSILRSFRSSRSR